MPAPRRTAQNEADRLRALYAYDILDSEPEPSFDRITNLAARLFDAPIVLVSLIEDDRQWFKSCIGLSVRETPTSVSFCKHTLCGDELLVVPDATKDERFKDNPVVTADPKIRFYAGAPLITPDGYNLGTLCVIDTEPRDDLTSDDRKTLQELADIVIDELELRRVHRQTEAGLRQQAETVVQAIELAEDAICILDADCQFVFLNKAHETLYGYPLEELRGRHLQTLYDADEFVRYSSEVLPALEAHGHWQGPCIARCRDGTPIEQEVSLSKMPNGGFIRVARDVRARNTAERRQQRLEAELHQAQKLESIGRLAGGIAHDFNNILAAIEGYAGFLVDDLPPNSREAGYAQQIVTASERGKTLVQQILSFSRRDPIAMHSIDIAEVVSETIGLLRAALPKNLVLDSELPDDLLQVRGNQTALARAVMNLATNARDAIDDPVGGRVLISVSTYESAAPTMPDSIGAGEEVEGLGRVHMRTLTDGDYELQVGEIDTPGRVVEIAVIDNGIGIRSEILPHVVEPFYTTKPTGSGTGLGLSAVAGIALSHGGTLTIRSRPGHGTRVSMALPQIEAEAIAPPPTAPRIPNRPTVLVVDDERAIAEMIGDSIERLGRHAVITTSPHEALEILEGKRDEISCVITDLMMPEMIGSNLAEKAKQIAPNVMVILCSGRSFLTHQVDNPAIDHVLEKPIRREALEAVFATRPASPTAPSDHLSQVVIRNR